MFFAGFYLCVWWVQAAAAAASARFLLCWLLFCDFGAGPGCCSGVHIEQCFWSAEQPMFRTDPVCSVINGWLALYQDVSENLANLIGQDRNFWVRDCFGGVLL